MKIIEKINLHSLAFDTLLKSFDYKNNTYFYKPQDIKITLRYAKLSPNSGRETINDLYNI